MLLAWRWFFRVARTGFWLLRAPCGSPCLCAGSLREMRLWPELTHVCDWAGLSVLLLGHVSRSMEPSAKKFRLGWFHFWVYLLIVTILLIIFFLIFISVVHPDTPFKLGSAVQELTWGQNVTFLFFSYPCSGWNFPTLSFVLQDSSSTWYRSCSQESETPGSHTNQSSGMLWFILNHQRLKNEQIFWGRCVSLQSHGKTAFCKFGVCKPGDFH